MVPHYCQLGGGEKVETCLDLVWVVFVRVQDVINASLFLCASIVPPSIYAGAYSGQGQYGNLLECLAPHDRITINVIH